MAKKKLSKEEIEKQAFLIVETEQKNWEDAVCYVTDKVGFRMRELIRVCRKNYWGVFDEPRDKGTGQDKIWGPLSMALVEEIVPNIDLDTKDVNFRARNPKGTAITEITRSAVKEYLERTNFADTLDESERTLCIDGTVVWKTWKGAKGKLIRKTVDLLNIYIDPTEENIQTAYRFTERSLISPDQLKGMTGWRNTEGAKGSTNLIKGDATQQSAMAQPTTGSFVDVWEMWGKMPKCLITGLAEDKEEVDGHIVVSGIQSQDRRLHLVEINGNKDSDGNIIKPYEEGRVAKITGRWYGLGFVERVLALQEYLNITLNIRKNRALISQLGLFKIKKGSGITPQMLSKLSSNGAISVNQQDDIEQFQIQSVDQSSYNDEEVIKSWAQKVTQAFPISTGEMLPASTTATQIAIQNANAKNAYSMTKDAIASLIKRWMDRHALPIIASTISIGDIIRLGGGDEKLTEIIERVVAVEATRILDEMAQGGNVPPEMEVQQAMLQAQEMLRNKPYLFIELLENIIAKNLETQIYITNEDIDIPVTIQNLIATLQLAPEYREDTIAEIYDLLGLRRPKVNKEMQQAQIAQMRGAGGAGGAEGATTSHIPTAQGITTGASTI